MSDMETCCPQPLERIRPDTHIPQSVDVVVVGAGIAGASTAWELARAGIKVALLDKGRVGAEQSSRNWGWVRQQGRDPKELELARLSLALWPDLSHHLSYDVGFKACGVTFLTSSVKELAAWEAWCRIGQSYGVDCQILSAREANSRTKASSGTQPWIGGLYTPSDGRAEPSRVVPALATAAQRLGAIVVEGCAVSRMETSNGKISAVVTEKGKIACNAVLVAGGAWARVFLAKHGIRFPQAYVNSSVAHVSADDLLLEGSVATPDFAIRRTSDGYFIIGKVGRGNVVLTPALLQYARAFWPTYRARRKNVQLHISPRRFWQSWRQECAYLGKKEGGFLACRVLNPAPDLEFLEQALTAARQQYPELAMTVPELSWGGCIDSMPDAIPVLSDVKQFPGLYIAAGFSGHGFGLTTGTGQAMAAMILGKPAPIDMQPFSYNRLVDGSRLEPYLFL